MYVMDGGIRGAMNWELGRTNDVLLVSGSVLSFTRKQQFAKSETTSLPMMISQVKYQVKSSQGKPNHATSWRECLLFCHVCLQVGRMSLVSVPSPALLLALLRTVKTGVILYVIDLSA